MPQEERPARPGGPLGRDVAGEYVRPSYNAFYTLLRHKNHKTGRYDFDVADYAARLSAWTTAQAGKLPRTRRAARWSRSRPRR